jgi:predicted RNA methylase
MFGLKPKEVLSFHARLLGDRRRTEAYREAIQKTVRPGDVVADLGAGSGILSYFACQAGARRVYAVEAGPMVEYAREVARRNGFLDRLVFIRDLSYRVALPERVDVIVSETLGAFGLEESTLSLIEDARARLLRPGGTIIPRSVELLATPLESPQAYRAVEFWAELYGIDFSPLRPYAVNIFHDVRLSPESLLTAPVRVGAIDLHRLERVTFSGAATCQASRAGVMHGLGGWFDAELAPGVRLTNQPPGRDSHWMQVFLPLAEPVPLATGDRLAIRIQSVDGTEWRWRVEAEGRLVGDHSTFFSFPASLSGPERRSLDYAPKLSRRGEIERFVLELLDGQTTVRQMAEQALARYLDYFQSPQEAEAFVREVAARAS